MARGKRRRRGEEEENEEEEVPPSDPDELEEEELQDDDEQQEEAQAGPSSSKRQRSEYPKGTVKKVKVYNFMTYGTPAVEIIPGPRLNLVLGPNGTGKSSLVCALCLGLTGAPKLLGRADNLKDFIRRGADSGWVETTLSGGPGRPDKVICCEMRKTAEGYSTNWRINGATKPMRDVKELVKDMNIQFDNLCQFLPQDKVVEFARLNPYELLIATEKAIGDSSLYDTHMELIQRRDAMKTREQKRDAEQQAHDQLVAQNQVLERDYQRFEKKQKLEKSIQVIKKKLAWMDVREAQEAARQATDEEKEKTKQLQEARKAAKGDERPARQREQQAMTARQQLHGLMQDIKKQEQRVKKAMDKVANEEQTVRQLRGQISSLASESATRKNDIDKLKKKLQLAEQYVEKCGPTPDHTAEIRQLAEQQTELNMQVHSLENEKLQIMNELSSHARQKGQIEGALREANTAAYQRMNAIIHFQGRLMNFDDNLRAFTQLVALKRSQGLFRGQVVGPLGAEIKLRSSINGAPLNPAWVSNLEQTVFFQMANFAVQTRDDEKLLTEELRIAKLHSIKVVVVTQDINTPIASETPALRQYGVVASLNELFDAPPLVRHALNNVCGLDTTYVMSVHDLDKARAMMEQQRGVHKVYSPEQCMTYVRSAYGGREDASMKTSDLIESKILRTGAGADVDERKQQLEQQLTAIQGRMADLEDKQRQTAASMQPLHAQFEGLQQQIKALQDDTNKHAAQKRRLQTQIKAVEKLLADKERSPDPLSQAPELERKLKATMNKHHAAVSETLACTVDNWQALQQHVVAELSLRELDMQAKAMLAHHQEQQRAVTVLEGEHRTALARAKALADAYIRLKQEAEENHPLDAAAKRAFEALSDDRDELRADLAEFEEKVDNITVSNPRVAQEYRQRKDQIESKAKELSDLQAQLDIDAQQLDLLKANWLPELQRVVSLINSSFSTNFSEIGCAGEVALQQDQDYDKFSIQIKVKFREEEQLTLLTASRQSGGERSVSTILYLIALQGVTVTPFRVVDEINQGMDPSNERKVFEQLVTASCKEGTPQCFLLTPKLLPDLPFTEDITVLNIFNGALINEAVVERYSNAKLFGSKNLQTLRQLNAVHVAG